MDMEEIVPPKNNCTALQSLISCVKKKDLTCDLILIRYEILHFKVNQAVHQHTDDIQYEKSLNVRTWFGEHAKVGECHNAYGFFLLWFANFFFFLIFCFSDTNFMLCPHRKY